MARRQALVAIAQARVRPLGVEVLAPVHDDDLGLSLSRNSAVESRRGIFHRLAGAEREATADGVSEDRQRTGIGNEPEAERHRRTDPCEFRDGLSAQAVADQWRESVEHDIRRFLSRAVTVEAILNVFKSARAD